MENRVKLGFTYLPDTIRITNWCNDQFGKKNWTQTLHPTGEKTFEFKTESDALLFSLKWTNTVEKSQHKFW
jgi:hypothetical protein